MLRRYSVNYTSDFFCVKSQIPQARPASALLILRRGRQMGASFTRWCEFKGLNYKVLKDSHAVRRACSNLSLQRHQNQAWSQGLQCGSRSLLCSSGTASDFFLHVKGFNPAKQCDLDPARCPELQEKNNTMSLFFWKYDEWRMEEIQPSLRYALSDWTEDTRSAHIYSSGHKHWNQTLVCSQEYESSPRQCPGHGIILVLKSFKRFLFIQLQLLLPIWTQTSAASSQATCF